MQVLNFALPLLLLLVNSNVMCPYTLTKLSSNVNPKQKMKKHIKGNHRSDDNMTICVAYIDSVSSQLGFYVYTSN